MKKIYPTCRNTFRKWCKSNISYENIYNKLGKPRPFDVTLRDGLQGLSIEEQIKMTSIDKIHLYNNIKEKHNPLNMEIGSIVSSKILPIFNDSSIIYNTIEYNKMVYTNDYESKNFILIPNEEQFKKINQFIGLECFSFITSVSESFQQKNTKMSLDTTFCQLNNMFRYLDDMTVMNTVKLYVSCINECPIEGKIDNDIIVDKILTYQKLKPDILCLSDTCGSLTENDLKYILTSLCLVSPFKKLSNISLHLHVKPGRENDIEKLIHTALDFGIVNFDVSELKTGGCSVTIQKSSLAPNLSYDLYYKSLVSYILKKSEE